MSCRKEKSLLVLTRRYCVRDCSGNPAVALASALERGIEAKSPTRAAGKTYRFAKPIRFSFGKGHAQIIFPQKLPETFIKTIFVEIYKKSKKTRIL